jgi:hypothetical protein
VVEEFIQKEEEEKEKEFIHLSKRSSKGSGPAHREDQSHN